MPLVTEIKNRIDRKIKWVRNELADPPRLKPDFKDVDYDKLRAAMSESQIRERDERIALAEELYSDNGWNHGDVDPDVGFCVEEKLDSQEYRDGLAAIDEIVADPRQHKFMPRALPLAIDISPFNEAHAPILRYALSDELVGRASRYLSQIPALSACWLWFTPPDQKAVGGSQYYHLDNEDTSILKVFTAITDQSMESGPLSVVRRDVSQKIFLRIVEGGPYKGVNYFRASRIDDHAVEDNCPPGEPTKLVARRGNVTFADTAACYHYGSRPISRSNGEDRWVLQIRYVKSDSAQLLCSEAYQKVEPSVPVWLERNDGPRSNRARELLLQLYCAEHKP